MSVRKNGRYKIFPVLYQEGQPFVAVLHGCDVAYDISPVYKIMRDLLWRYRVATLPPAAFYIFYDLPAECV